ncbi:ACH96237.1 pif-3-like protein [Kallithea virus]|uniref:ACH96237.1 pif-3-like protein n=1 Tax=Kallithea virus TaxID=1654582 RepID=A0A0F7KLQ3_9VIRU|nr:ACH96237.1 pif-3-like protein [Kallithea virus]AKH40396.1 putative pif-3 [Kallithea virus]AQN78619.1 ACH96237.1 pif-3-like protein [Kallithea virus]
MNINNHTQLHIVVIAIILILILIVIVIKKLDTSNIVSELQQHVEFPGTNQTLAKRDCDTETIYSMDDSQCIAICREPGVFINRNGICVNVRNFDNTSVENECNPKNGVIAYLTGDTQMGKTNLLCLSIDPGVQPDNIDMPNTLCMDGDLDINYIESFPNLRKCKCPQDKTLTIIPDTSAIRTRGVCIKNQLLPIFQLNRLIYTNV